MTTFDPTDSVDNRLIVKLLSFEIPSLSYNDTGNTILRLRGKKIKKDKKADGLYPTSEYRAHSLKNSIPNNGFMSAVL